MKLYIQLRESHVQFVPQGKTELCSSTISDRQKTLAFHKPAYLATEAAEGFLVERLGEAELIFFFTDGEGLRLQPPPVPTPLPPPPPLPPLASLLFISVPFDGFWCCCCCCCCCSSFREGETGGNFGDEVELGDCFKCCICCDVCCWCCCCWCC